MALALRIRLERISGQGDISGSWRAKGNRDAQRQYGAQGPHGTPPGVVAFERGDFPGGEFSHFCRPPSIRPIGGSGMADGVVRSGGALAFERRTSEAA